MPYMSEQNFKNKRQIYPKSLIGNSKVLTPLQNPVYNEAFVDGQTYSDEPGERIINQLNF